MVVDPPDGVVAPFAPAAAPEAVSDVSLVLSNASYWPGHQRSDCRMDLFLAALVHALGCGIHAWIIAARHIWTINCLPEESRWKSSVDP